MCQYLVKFSHKKRPYQEGLFCLVFLIAYSIDEYESYIHR